MADDEAEEARRPTCVYRPALPCQGNAALTPKSAGRRDFITKGASRDRLVLELQIARLLGNQRSWFATPLTGDQCVPDLSRAQPPCPAYDAAHWTAVMAP